MPEGRLSHKEILTPQQREFCRLYVTGEQGVRGMAGEAYKRSGYRVRTDYIAQVNATRLLSAAKIQREIARLHAQTDAQTIVQLNDWKLLAPEAQRQLYLLMTRYLPNPQARDGRQLICTREDAAVARIVLDASLAILDRAYPPKLYAELSWQDPDAVLAQLLGVPVAEMKAVGPVSLPAGLQ